jgi:hypothetical protein
MAAISLQQKKLSECEFLTNIDETHQETQEVEPADKHDDGLICPENQQDSEDDKRVPKKVNVLAIQQKRPEVSQLIISPFG